MTKRTLPAQDLKLIDDRRLVCQGEVGAGPFRGAAFQTSDGMGVIVSIDTDTPAGEAFHISVTRPGRQPGDDDLAVVRIAICGPGRTARIVTAEGSLLRGQIVHLIEEPEDYEAPPAPWWTPQEFDAFAAQMARASGTAPERGHTSLETLQRLGLIRVNRHHDPARGEVIQVDMRALFWRDERRRRRKAEPEPPGPS